MSTTRDRLQPRRLRLLAPEEPTPQDPRGAWIVDVSGLADDRAAERLESLRRGCRKDGGSVYVVGSAPVGLTEELAQLLETELDDLDLDLSIPAAQRYVSPLCRLVAHRVEADFGRQPAFQMKLVLEELCSNAVEHGTTSASRIRVQILLRERTLRYRVGNEYGGTPRPARVLRHRVLEFDASGRNMEERGRGLFLVARIMDGLRAAEEEGWLWVEVWKDLGGPPVL